MSEKVLSKEQVASIQRFGTDFHHEATVDEGMVLGHWHGSKRGLTLGDAFDSHEALRAERDAARAELAERMARDVEDAKLLDTTHRILTDTANALKGAPEPLHSHSWHDLAEVAAKLKADREHAVSQLNQVHEELGGSDTYNTLDLAIMLKAEVERMRGHADRLAEALERAEQLLSRANRELEKHKSGRNMWHDIADYFDPADLGGSADALTAYRASAQKEGVPPGYNIADALDNEAQKEGKR